MKNDEQLLQFAENLRQEVISRSELEGQEDFRGNAFTEIVCGYLSEAGELDDATVCYNKARGEEVSGYSLSVDGDCLDLIISIHSQSVPPVTVTRAEVDTAFKRLLGFLGRALQGGYASLEQASPAHDMTLTIHDARNRIERVRLFLLTDGRTTEVKKTSGTHLGLDVSYHVWDIERLFRCMSSGQQREPIEIDFREMFGESIPCLTMPGNGADYRAYLAIIRGDVLAKLYDEYGPRLLERNVRSFLQAKGKVNRSIQQTIKVWPERFLAYNNGISITAADIRVERRSDGSHGIAWAQDLQIVNGGQTTASIHHAMRREKADVSAVHVQAKISVIDPGLVDELVPLISRYANSQNKVNEADFFANDRFHVTLEKLSRTIWAPAAVSSHRQTRWFYERARGQYQDAKGREPTPARKRDFATIHPPTQKFTKTDLAKFENTWDQMPHNVSYGAEKNFRVFTSRLAERRPFEPDQYYFERLVAKAILFRRAEKIVQDQQFGGYRANIVTYALALISHKTSQRIDLERIWRAQDISDALADCIAEMARKVHAAIISPPDGRNVTEWCKREECWKRILELPVEVPQAVQVELISVDRESARSIDRGINGANAEDRKVIEEVARVPAETWFKISRWAKETNNLDSWQRSLAYDLGKLAGRGKDPSRKQATQALKILHESRKLGFQIVEAEGVTAKVTD